MEICICTFLPAALGKIDGFPPVISETVPTGTAVDIRDIQEDLSFIPAIQHFQLLTPAFLLQQDRAREHCGWREGLKIGEVSQHRVARRKMPDELIVS